MRYAVLLSTVFYGLTLAPVLAQTPTPPRPPAPDEYPTEQAARSRCGNDPVVWANLDSKIYHVPGDKFYGTTKQGAFMCRTIAGQHGIRAAK